MRRRFALASLLVVIACAIAPARDALGAPVVGDKAAAQALFDDGLKLMTSAKYDQACPKLEESLRLDPAMGTRFRLSECYEAVGRTASAWAGYVEVADLARAAGQASREKIARERAAHLEPSLARLEIVVATPALVGLELRRDGVIVGAAQWGAAIPVDPGPVRLTATAPGKVAWKSEATIAKAGEKAVVRVPPLEDAPPSATPAPATTAPVPPVAPAPAAAREPPRDEDAGGGRRTIGAVVAGAGIAGMATSGVLGLMALSKYNGTGAHCVGDVCDSQGKDTTDSARRLADVATVVFGVGAALAVGGVVIFLTAPRAAPAAKTAVRVRFGPQAVLLEGGF